MSTELRQFVYLDSQAVNSILASMYMAVPRKLRNITEETDEEANEAGAEAGFKFGTFLNFGGYGSRSTSETERNLSRVEKQINDQYRFSILIKALEEDEETRIYDIPNEDTGEVESGSIIRLKGECTTDPLYPLLGALEHIIGATSEAPKGNGFWARLIQNQSELGQVEEFYQLLYGGWVGLDIFLNDTTRNFGTVINENQMWTNSYREFRGTNEYTILGRVQKQVPSGEIWDLVEALRVINSVTSDSEASANRAELVAKILESLEDQDESKEFELPELSPEDFVIEGPATIINPIAIYW
jgi:hypothetical protein